MPRTVRILLIGLGNLGRRFCDLLVRKRDLVETRFGLNLLLIGVADSSGVAYDSNGLDPAQISQVKLDGGGAADLPRVGHADLVAADLFAQLEADVLCEASPVNLRQGAEPGLTHIRMALERSIHVATPNKGPLVLAYRELHELAATHRVKLRFDGTVAGGLPALAIGQRDLRGATVSKLEAVPNLCTGFVLELLGDGLSWEEAQERARSEGVLEADPSFDLEGWDAAAKLVILVNAVMEHPAKLEDVQLTGITGLSGEAVREARQKGLVHKLVATATRTTDDSVSMQVEPNPLPSDHFLSRLGRKQMGVIYHTDIYGTLMTAIDEPDPLPSAATMLRDMLDIFAPMDGERG